MDRPSDNGAMAGGEGAPVPLGSTLGLVAGLVAAAVEGAGDGDGEECVAWDERDERYERGTSSVTGYGPTPSAASSDASSAAASGAAQAGADRWRITSTTHETNDETVVTGYEASGSHVWTQAGTANGTSGPLGSEALAASAAEAGGGARPARSRLAAWTL